MKYIRTKDGIYENEFVHVRIYGNGRCLMECKDKLYLAPLEVKQADTIEELCDYVFYRFIEDNELEIKKIKKVNMRVLKSWYKNNIVKDVMFAILTDKGLIYVAKMNDKGELELL